jgi:hypothetical protein
VAEIIGGEMATTMQLRIAASDTPTTTTSKIADKSKVGRAFERFGFSPLLVYTAISVLVFARPLLPDFVGSYIGQGSDPADFMWFLVWWPYAIAHHVNPFLTHAIFAPGGLNLAWSTTIPLGSLLLAPITATLGPVVAYNILSIASPALAAWTAFILCRYISRSYWPALLGGYIFGFSSYMLAQTLGGHLHMTLVFPVPLALYIAARTLDRTLKPSTSAALMGVTLAVQFLLSVEIFATLTVFGVMAIVLALGFTLGEDRRRIAKILTPIAGAYALMLLLAGPYLSFMFAGPGPVGQIQSTSLFSADALNFLIPTAVNVLGGLYAFRVISNKFQGNIFELGAYTGPVLIALVLAFAWRRWREPFGKLLVDSLIIIWVLSLGPILHVGGNSLGSLPGKLFSALPALDKALPTRFTMYAFLIVAIITSLWLAASPARRRTKYAAAFLVMLFSLPNLGAAYWTSKVDTPAFFSKGIYRRYLAPDENVFFISDAVAFTSNMLWQAQTGMYFRMAGGSIEPVPDEYRPWPILYALGGPAYVPDAQWQLVSFLASHDVKTIVVCDRTPDSASLRALLPTFTLGPLEVGGVTLYRIAPGTLDTYRHVTGVEAERRAAVTLFDSLLMAASNYALEGKDPGELTLPRALNLKLMPADWRKGPSKVPEWLAGTAFDPTPSLDTRIAYDIWLGHAGGAYLGIGLTGTYEGLAPIISNYNRDAFRVYFPAPEILTAGARDKGRGLLLMVFDRDGLVRAVTRAASSPSKIPSSSPLQDTALIYSESPRR